MAEPNDMGPSGVCRPAVSSLKWPVQWDRLKGFKHLARPAHDTLPSACNHMMAEVCDCCVCQALHPSRGFWKADLESTLTSQIYHSEAWWLQILWRLGIVQVEVVQRADMAGHGHPHFRMALPSAVEECRLSGELSSHSEVYASL